MSPALRLVRGGNRNRGTSPLPPQPATAGPSTTLTLRADRDHFSSTAARRPPAPRRLPPHRRTRQGGLPAHPARRTCRRAPPGRRPPDPSRSRPRRHRHPGPARREGRIPPPPAAPAQPDRNRVRRVGRTRPRRTVRSSPPVRIPPRRSRDLRPHPHPAHTRGPVVIRPRPHRQASPAPQHPQRDDPVSSTPPGQLRLLPSTGPTSIPPPQVHPAPPTTETAPDVSSDLLRADREEMTGRLRGRDAHFVHHSLVIAAGHNGIHPAWRLAVPLYGSREAGTLRADEPYFVTALMRLVHRVGFPMAAMTHPALRPSLCEKTGSPSATRSTRRSPSVAPRPRLTTSPKPTSSRPKGCDGRCPVTTNFSSPVPTTTAPGKPSGRIPVPGRSNGPHPHSQEYLCTTTTTATALTR